VSEYWIGPGTVPRVSVYWIGAGVTVVVACLYAVALLGRLSHRPGESVEPDELELRLAEAADHLEVLAAYRPDLMETARRLEVLADSMSGPLNSARTLRRAMGHWWRRGRHLHRNPAPGDGALVEARTPPAPGSASGGRTI